MTDREFLIELKRALTIALRAVEARLGDTVEVKGKAHKAA